MKTYEVVVQVNYLLHVQVQAENPEQAKVEAFNGDLLLNADPQEETDEVVEVKEIQP